MHTTYFREYTPRDFNTVLGLQLREADINEIQAVTGVSPKEALQVAIPHTTHPYVIIHKGQIEGVFGCEDCGETGAPWFLTTEKFKEFNTLHFLRESKRVVKMWTKKYRYLENYVCEQHIESLVYLKWLGFSFERGYAFSGVPFLKFYTEKEIEKCVSL